MISDLIVFQKTYDFLLWVKPTVQRFAKVHKYGLGAELEKETLQLLRQIIRANMFRTDKRRHIAECFVGYFELRNSYSVSIFAEHQKFYCVKFSNVFCAGRAK